MYVKLSRRNSSPSPFSLEEGVQKMEWIFCVHHHMLAFSLINPFNFNLNNRIFKVQRRFNFIMIKKILPLFIVLTILSAQIEFNEGPYGAEYFDIAGPFTLVDLNLELGDVNSDNTVNILDIIATANYILSQYELTEDQFFLMDVDGDNTITIMDIIQIVNIILDNTA